MELSIQQNRILEVSAKLPREEGLVRIQCCVCGIPISDNVPTIHTHERLLDKNFFEAEEDEDDLPESTKFNPFENSSNMCNNCIKKHIDLSDGMTKDYILVYCPECERYLVPPSYWQKADLESKELMTICLKKIKGLSHNSATSSSGGNTSKKFSLVDASFIWTEPHSKKLKLKLTIQKELFVNTIIEQSVTIDYDVQWKQCPSCQKANTNQFQYEAVIQLRQKNVTHKKTFLYLEQMILKHKMHENIIKIESHPDGLDFFFMTKSSGLSFIDFVSHLAPISRGLTNSLTSNSGCVQLVSHDSKNNTAVQHFSYSLFICPLCREDLIVLPKAIFNKMGSNVGPVVVVHKVYNSIVFIDPFTLRAGEVTNTLYWKDPFMPLASYGDLVVFYVLDVTINYTTMKDGKSYTNSDSFISGGSTVTTSGGAGSNVVIANGKFVLATVTVCLESEVGVGREFIVNSHLGAILNPGDYVKGYLVSSINANNKHTDELEEKNAQGGSLGMHNSKKRNVGGHSKRAKTGAFSTTENNDPENDLFHQISTNSNNSALPDVVLVRKHFPSQLRRRKNRYWKLKHLNITTGTTSANQHDIAGDDSKEVENVKKKSTAGERRAERYNTSNGNNFEIEYQKAKAEFEDEIERDVELRKEFPLYIDKEALRRHEKKKLAELKAKKHNEKREEKEEATAQKDKKKEDYVDDDEEESEEDMEEDDDLPVVEITEMLEELDVMNGEEEDGHQNSNSGSPNNSDRIVMKKKRLGKQSAEQ